MELNPIARRLGLPTRSRRPEAREDGPGLLPLKTRSIDIVCDRFAPSSLADLGAVWRINAGYSFYAAAKPGIERVVICDGLFNDTVLERAETFDNVETFDGLLGAPETVNAVGDVDVVLFFDILLHQVDPDWDEMLRMYAPHTNTFVLVGPWWQEENTVRLVDLPREEYLDLLPSKRADYELIIDHLDEPHPRLGRPWRDASDIWQWGIADGDLRRVMDELGFALAHYENLGPWNETTRFDDCSYIFVRKEMLAAETA